MVEKKAALVLSGGGALGAAHIGVLEEIMAAGYRFDFYAGVSAGAIVSAALACGRPLAEIRERLLGTRFFDVFDWAKTKTGLIRGERVHALLDEVFGEKCFADLAMPLIIGTTDFQNGEHVALRAGKIANAVRASISVPILFEPVWEPQQQRWLVDGGLTQNLPLGTVAAEYPGDLIIAVDVATSLNSEWQGPVERSFGRWRSYRNQVMRCVRIMLYSQQAANPADPRIKIIRPLLGDIAAIEVQRIGDLLELGRQAGREWLRSS